MQRVIAQIAADYQRLDPKDAAYFAQRAHAFESTEPGRYNRLRSEIRTRYAGVPVGYSESIFQPLGQSLGLQLLTPYSFAKAIAEGTDVSAADKQTVDRQAEDQRDQGVGLQQPERHARRAARQPARPRGAHPDRDRHRDALPRLGHFEQWQSAQLSALRAALHKATGR